mmetsp:Transcript_2037/g.6449  ORF Transcript_2037/g.6449 Transcript_2037/m.6449 type:complete len:430 (+) Transcript_2037:703-1992(+)
MSGSGSWRRNNLRRPATACGSALAGSASGTPRFAMSRHRPMVTLSPDSRKRPGTAIACRPSQARHSDGNVGDDVARARASGTPKTRVGCSVAFARSITTAIVSIHAARPSAPATVHTRRLPVDRHSANECMSSGTASTRASCNVTESTGFPSPSSRSSCRSVSTPCTSRPWYLSGPRRTTTRSPSTPLTSRRLAARAMADCSALVHVSACATSPKVNEYGVDDGPPLCPGGFVTMTVRPSDAVELSIRTLHPARSIEFLALPGSSVPVSFSNHSSVLLRSSRKRRFDFLTTQADSRKGADAAVFDDDGGSASPPSLSNDCGWACAPAAEVAEDLTADCVALQAARRSLTQAAASAALAARHSYSRADSSVIRNVSPSRSPPGRTERMDCSMTMPRGTLSSHAVYHARIDPLSKRQRVAPFLTSVPRRTS